MNEKFFSLSIEKRRRIINAAYKVFSQNSYKKVPMSEVASESGISKALLFYYFTNKKELYMYLWICGIEVTKKAIEEYQALKAADFFEMLKRGMLAKCSVMRKYPYVFAFLLKAYYEQQPDIRRAIHGHYEDISEKCMVKILELIDQKMLRTDIDLKIMCREIILAVDGYMFQKYHAGVIDPDEIERDFAVLIEHWRTIYCVSEEGDGHD